MGAFDYNNYHVVGIVENIPASNHSYIHVIGHTDAYSSYNIHRYSTPDEVKSVFAKKGRVFAYMFAHLLAAFLWMEGNYFSFLPSSFALAFASAFFFLAAAFSAWRFSCSRFA